MDIEEVIDKYKIDKSKDEWKDLPYTLNGEIFLEAVRDSNGELLGYITISEDDFRSIYTDPNHDFAASGHLRYKQRFEQEFP